MFVSCNHTGWYATAIDRLLFQTVMASAGLPTPGKLAVTRRTGFAGGAASLATASESQVFLREPSHYLLLAETVNGMRNLAVLSAHWMSREADQLSLHGQRGRRPVVKVARQLLARESGFVIQRRLAPHAGKRLVMAALLAWG